MAWLLGAVSLHAGNLNISGNVSVSSNLTAQSVTLTNSLAGSGSYRAALRLGPNTGEGALPAGITFYDGSPLQPSWAMWGGNSSSSLFGGGVVNDSYRRFRIAAGGTLNWGSGAAVADTTLWRAGSNSLATAGTFSAATAVFSGDVTVNGKLNVVGTIDPPSLLLDAVTRAHIARRTAREIPPEKRSGAVLFFNSVTQRLEVYLPSVGGFYNLAGTLITNITPPTVVGQCVTNYMLDAETGEVVPQVSYQVPRWQLKAGYSFNRATGTFEFASETNEVGTVRPASKAEALELQ